MSSLKTTFIIAIFLIILHQNDCGIGRSGGSRSSSSRSYSSSRTYSAPRARPSPPPRYRPAPTTSRPYIRPQSTFTPHRAVTSRPNYGANPSVTQRPNYGFGTTRRPNIGTTSRPFYGYTTRRPYYASTPRYGTGGSGGWNVPPRPGSGPVGPTYQGPSKVKIVNKYNYHYPGYYSLPVHYSHPGYFYTPSYYHYGSSDTGSTALGFFLGYGLGRLTTPTYSHYSFYDGYRPRYDHYTVHHYYHNRESVPQQQTIPANTIVGCAGDSNSICPGNTVSLCTASGALMCVASATTTVPCTDNRQVNCVTSTISCENNPAPECKNTNQKTTTINIPCVSNANINGDVKYVNNTIIPTNVTNIGIPVNTTMTGPQGPPITTTTTTTTTLSPLRLRRDVVQQNFCVTVLALPAKREPTEGEKFFDDASFIAGKFVENAWHLP